MRKTKIICTLGPSSESYDVLKEMVQAGMSVARFNMAHGSYEEHQRRIDVVKAVREDLGRPVAIMMDIKGPEVRTGQVDNPFDVNVGDKIESNVKIGVSGTSLNDLEAGIHVHLEILSNGKHINPKDAIGKEISELASVVK